MTYYSFFSRSIILMFYFSLCDCFLFGKSFGKESFKDNLYACVETPDHGYLAVGSTESWCGGLCFDVFILKLNDQVEVVFVQALEFTASIDSAMDIIETMDGNYLIVGYIGCPTFAYDCAVLVLKINITGDVIFSKKYVPGWVDGDSLAFEVLEEDDGDFIIGGEISMENEGEQLLLLKIDSDGDIIFQNTFGANNNDYIGSYSPLARLSDGYVLGGTTNYPESNNSAFITKFSKNGSVVLWSYAFIDGQERTTKIETIFTLNGSNDLILLGTTEKGTILLRVEGESGTIIWAKTYTADFVSMYLIGKDAVENNVDRSIVITGLFCDDLTCLSPVYFFMKITSEGEVVYCRYENNPQFADGDTWVNSIQPASNDQFLLTGYIETGIGMGSRQGYLHRIYYGNMSNSEFEVVLEVIVGDWNYVKIDIKEEGLFEIVDANMTVMNASFTQNAVDDFLTGENEQTWYWKQNSCGRYRDDEIDMVCSGFGECLMNEYCSCRTLYSLNQDNISCSPCPLGWEKSEISNYSCTYCPVGYTSNYLTTNTCVICSPGYFENGERICEACPMGSYQEMSGMVNCDLCPAGTYGKETSSDSKLKCKPCREGFKQPYQGKMNESDCINCQVLLACPKGSAKEFKTRDGGDFSETTIHDSLAYSIHTVAYETKLFMMTGFFVVGLLCICCVYCMFCCNLLSLKRLGKVCFCLVQFRNLDIFYNLSHEVRENESPVKRRTSHGGIFSSLAVVLMVTFVSWSIADYTVGNKKIEKTTDFYFFGTDEAIEGRMIFSVFLYGGFSDCNSSFSLTGFEIKSESPLYYRTEFFYVDGEEEGEREVGGCLLELTCPQCRVVDPEELELQFIMNYERKFIRMVEYSAQFPHYNPDEKEFYSLQGRIYAYDGTLDDSSITLSLFLTEFRSLSSWTLITQMINQELNTTQTGVGANVISVTKNKVDEVSQMSDPDFMTFTYTMRLSNFKYRIEERFPQSLLNFFAQLFALFGGCVATVGVIFMMYDRCCSYSQKTSKKVKGIERTLEDSKIHDTSSCEKEEEDEENIENEQEKGDSPGLGFYEKNIKQSLDHENEGEDINSSEEQIINRSDFGVPVVVMKNENNMDPSSEEEQDIFMKHTNYVDGGRDNNNMKNLEEIIEEVVRNRISQIQQKYDEDISVLRERLDSLVNKL